jgi:hypothetical protein
MGVTPRIHFLIGRVTSSNLRRVKIVLNMHIEGLSTHLSKHSDAQAADPDRMCNSDGCHPCHTW